MEQLLKDRSIVFQGREARACQCVQLSLVSIRSSVGKGRPWASRFSVACHPVRDTVGAYPSEEKDRLLFSTLGALHVAGVSKRGTSGRNAFPWAEWTTPQVQGGSGPV